MTTALELWFYIALGVLALVAIVGGAIAAVCALSASHPDDIAFKGDYQRPTGKQRERCRRKVENAFSLRKDHENNQQNHRL